MNEDKGKVADKASEIARNIWLAGVGAYGRAVEEAQGRLEKAMEPPKLFRDLVKVGAALEEDARQGTVAARHSVEERINRVRENFHNQRPARIEDVVSLHRKIDQLTRKVDRLSKILEQRSAPEAAERKGSRKAPASAKPVTKRNTAGGEKKIARRKSAGNKANSKTPRRAGGKSVARKSKA